MTAGRDMERRTIFPLSRVIHYTPAQEPAPRNAHGSKGSAKLLNWQETAREGKEGLRYIVEWQALAQSAAKQSPGNASSRFKNKQVKQTGSNEQNKPVD